MTEVESQLEEIALSLEDTNTIIKRKEALVKLESIPEFKEVILEGFFKDFAAHQAGLVGDPTMHDPEILKRVQNNIIAIGGLKGYLRTIIMEGNMALESKEAYEAERAELLREDLED